MHVLAWLSNPEDMFVYMQHISRALRKTAVIQEIHLKFGLISCLY